MQQHVEPPGLELLEIQVRTVIAETFRIPLTAVSSDLALGGHPSWDSLGHMNLIIRLEETFGRRFAGPTIRTMTNVSAIVQTIKKR